MKQLLAGIILALAVGPTWAQGTEKPDYFTSGQLYDICNKPAGMNTCTFIISGIMQGIDIRGIIDGKDEDCLAYSAGETTGDLQNIIVGFLAANKSMHQTPAATSVVMAIGSPACKAKLAPPRQAE